MDSLQQIRIAGTLAFFFIACGAQADLKKRDAFEILKSNGYRWQQINLLNSDAEAKRLEAQGLMGLHSSLYFREYAGKVNQLQYGFTDPGTLNWFVLGTTGIDFSYDIFNGVALARLKAAQSNENLSRANSNEFRNDLTYLMLVQFLNVQRLKRSLDVIDSNIDRDDKIFKATKLRKQMGAGVGLDVSRSEGLLEREKFRHLDATTSYFKARKELANTLGKSELPAELEPLSFKEVSVDENEARSKLDGRPDVVAARFAEDVAESFKLEAHREALPKVTLFGDVGTFGTQIGGIANSPTGTLGFQISIPLLSGGLISAREQEMNVKVESASLQEKQLRLESETQLEVALAQLKDARSAVSASNRQIEIAKEELEFSEKKLHSGAGGGLEVANAQVDVAMAFDLNVQAVFSYEVAKVNYFRAVGDFDRYFAFEGQK